ncbi:MAG TPA: alpha/beta hydrolase [Herpetosiphonaceae bacterium]|nr:alpha/beta hydrolase [Herpetosiphonaceae bacterium]
MSAPAPRPRRAWKIVRRITLICVSLVALCLLAGMVARLNLLRQHPAPGVLVDLGGYRLHLHCTGSGSPAVILESGQGELGLTWANVQPVVAKTTRVCSYDRAGYGWSEPGPQPRTASASVDELRALLQKAGVAPPYVLVGHSIGGLYAKLYAHRYPDEVAGMVLVDSSHEDQNEGLDPAFAAAIQQVTSQSERQISQIKPLIASGIMALAPGMMGASAKLPADTREAYNALLATDSRSIETNLAEFKATEASFAEVRAANITTLGAIPLLVLTRGQAEPLPPGVSIDPAVVAQAEERFHRLQTEVAALSSGGHLVVVEDSGHNIQLDQPAAVIGAIESVLEAVRP